MLFPECFSNQCYFVHSSKLSPIGSLGQSGDIYYHLVTDGCYQQTQGPVPSPSFVLVQRCERKRPSAMMLSYIFLSCLAFLRKASPFRFADAQPFRCREDAEAPAPMPALRQCTQPPMWPCGRVPPVVACLESAPARSLSAKAVPHPVCLSRFGAWTPSPAGTPTAWKAVRVFLAPTAAAAAARTSGGAVRVLPNYHLSVLDCLLARRTQLVTWASMT